MAGETANTTVKGRRRRQEAAAPAMSELMDVISGTAEVTSDMHDPHQRRRDGSPDICTGTDRDVPGCESGPLGRLRFVVEELRDLWREHRRHRTGKE